MRIEEPLPAFSNSQREIVHSEKEIVELIRALGYGDIERLSDFIATKIGLRLGHNETSSFIPALSHNICGVLSAAFSTAPQFYKTGLDLPVTQDGHPTGLRKLVEARLKIDIPQIYFLQDYSFTFCLDHKLVQEEQKLVFNLIEKSNGVAFLTYTFTLSDLSLFSRW